MAKKRAILAIKGLLRLALLLTCVSIAAFALVAVSPIDPLQTNVGQAALGSLSAEQVDKLRTYWGSGTPPVTRYLAWARDLLHGDMGMSLLYRQAVSAVIGEKLAQSLGLLAFAWVLSGIAGYTMGLIAGACQGRWPDRGIKGYALFMASTPTFWLALVLMMVFSVWLRVLPIGLSAPIGTQATDVTLADRIRHAILPAWALSITGAAHIALHTREKAIEVLHSEYAVFAQARGDGTWRILRRHGIRNTLLPALTLQFASIGEIIGGSVLVEQVFSYPGLGQAAVAAGLGGDVPLLLGIALVSAAIVCIGNGAANLLYGLVDPRIRRGEART